MRWRCCTRAWTRAARPCPETRCCNTTAGTLAVTTAPYEIIDRFDPTSDRVQSTAILCSIGLVNSTDQNGSSAVLPSDHEPAYMSLYSRSDAGLEIKATRTETDLDYTWVYRL
jgi:hypothetical protein